jgi:hypothetical protein
MKIKIAIIIFCISIGLKAGNYPGFYEVISPQMRNQVIEIPTGTYTFDLDNPDPLIKFSERKDVQIHGNGSTIICSKPGGVFRFENCENINVSGFTFDCNPRTSTQGTITNISGANSQTIEVKIHGGYAMLNPDDEASKGGILLFDKENRELIRNFHTAYAVGEMSVDNNTRKVTFDINDPKPGAYKVGDYVTFSSFPNGYGNHLIQSDFCKDMKFSDITVHDTRGASFLEHHCYNSYYYRCVIDRKKNDPLYEEEQLRTTSGDIIHAFFATKGPKVEECTFKYMCDDGINIGGFFYAVYNINKARKRIYLLLTSEAWWIFTLKVGDKLVCVDNDGSIKGKTRITSIDKPTEEPSAAEIKACTDRYATIRDKDLMKIGMSIQVDEWDDNFNNLIGGMVYTEDRVGSGFEIINCYMGHNRSRAALIKASDGLIKGNIFRGAAMPGISVAPEYYWLESGISHNLEITENLIEDCMFDANMMNSGQLAGLSVVSEAPKGGLTRTLVFENIRIHRNIIRGCPKPSVFLNAMSGYYYENTVEPDESMVRYHGYNLGVSNRDAYVEKYVGNIIKDKDPSTTIIPTKKVEELVWMDENRNLVFIDNEGNKEGYLIIYDVSGKTVIHNKFKKKIIAPLNDLDKGVYIVNLKYDNKLYSQKCIIK